MGGEGEMRWQTSSTFNRRPEAQVQQRVPQLLLSVKIEMLN
jgi:hypothetical protein